MKLNINEKNLENDINILSKIIDKSKPGFTRRPFTEYYQESRTWLKNEMETLNLNTYIDAASNLIGKREGSNPKLPPIMIGSHTDSVIGGGKYDGIIGVLAGLEIVRQLNKKNISLIHTILIVDFTAEEASEFGIATIGSSGMIGNLTDEQLSRKNSEGLNLAEGLSMTGGKIENIHAKSLIENDLSLYMELHIEQGPILDNLNYDLGVVTGIVGIQRYKVTLTGQPNHAGTTPMNMRFDALTAAAEIILFIEKLANEKYEDAVVGTVGQIFSKPNAANVIPGEVTIEFELRSINTKLLNDLVTLIKKEIAINSNKRDINIDLQRLSQSNPVHIKEHILKGIKKSCELVGMTTELPSGAGHDANEVSKITPVGMIFIPSKEGRSHCPEEYSSSSQVKKGAQALANALIYFDESLD